MLFKHIWLFFFFYENHLNNNTFFGESVYYKYKTMFYIHKEKSM